MRLSIRAAAIAAAGLLAVACGGDASTPASTIQAGTFETRLAAVALSAGLDVPAWQACRANPAMEARVVADMVAGVAAGVGGTPTFLVNGEPVIGNQPGAVFRSAIQAARTRAQASGLAAADYYATTFPGVPVGTSPSTGPADAWVTIVEFSDFQCPFCARVEPTVAQLLSKFPDKIRLVYRDYPLPNHGDAPKAAEAAHCAGDQGKYWEMHGRLFSNQDKLKVPDLKAQARELGLDGAKFDQCLDSGEKARLVEESRKAGDEAGVSGTPAFFINGRLLAGAQPLSAFEEIVNAELQPKAGK
jgi:protein-disulfide isomerase